MEEKGEAMSRRERVGQYESTRPRAHRVRWLTAVMASMLIGSAFAASAEDGPQDRPPLFMLGEHQVGFAVGYGHGVALGLAGELEGRDVRELILIAHHQLYLTRSPISQSWARGRLAFRSELTAMINFSPRDGWAGGLGLLLRYDFLALGRLQPYAQVGAGFLYLDYEIVDQADGFAFMPQLGAGLRWQLSPRHSFELGWRYHHISNAYTNEPNGGIDTMQILAGYAYHFPVSN